jgi:hypothetical protein
MQREVNNGRTPFREVLTDLEGVCLDCGYYAVASKEEMPANGKLYEVLFKEIEPPKKRNVKGGLSLKKQRESVDYYEKKARKNGEKERTN